ncbi:MAG: hypothetical protein ACXVMS_17800 [Flavisolibacter sp.]
MPPLSPDKRPELYNLSQQLVLACYAMTHDLPPEEKTNLVSYIRQAAVTVYLNLAGSAFWKEEEARKILGQEGKEIPGEGKEKKKKSKKEKKAQKKEQKKTGKKARKEARREEKAKRKKMATLLLVENALTVIQAAVEVLQAVGMADREKTAAVSGLTDACYEAVHGLKKQK